MDYCALHECGMPKLWHKFHTAKTMSTSPQIDSTLPASVESRHWLNPQDCQVSDLAQALSQRTDAAFCPSASQLIHDVPIYDCASLRHRLVTSSAGDVKKDLMAEWCWVWQDGPGVLVLKGAYANPDLVDAVTSQFQHMIEAERLTGSGGDHFAKPGANDRVWNALEKLCLRQPDLFARYYANDMVAMACEAWLGPNYQVTSQVNCVNPGGEAQMAHRDYHLGFCTPQLAARYPAHVHRLSPALTLQGAVAHVDMPLRSGPTLYLPHSQKYEAGYLVAGKPDFQAYFDAHCVQLPLEKGDAVFFNPALIHAAGHNRSNDIRRMANLLQVSSAFGRAMESVDRLRMSQALYPALQHLQGQLSAADVACAVAACAEGYAFPTNLDRDPPLGGLAPESQQALMLRALSEGWSGERYHQAALAQADKKLT